MRITSADQHSWMEINSRPDTANSGYESFSLEASVDIGHGQFRGINNDVHFLNIAEFAASLDAFVTDRSLAPRLEGSYDSFIQLSGTVNEIILEFRIGDAFCGYARTLEFQVSGAFEINQEYLLSLVENFRNFYSHDA
ncbi:MAG: hypothetical protein FWD77_04315 [Betaproteobacteria bacterium]|nr:hypothetical protein [Betaproteobacteria bacterium]